MLRPDLYYIAYQNLYANSGASTKGVNNDTADGFSEAKVSSIIEELTKESYSPLPVRRTYIQKANGKMRPLGIPTFTDKLIQEVLRMILEAVYEPLFLDCSHGFRPNRSCHTALKSITKGFNGIRWFVEGDIKGCFDNIDHAKLVDVICNKIKDARIIKLILKFLKAGYMENWKYNNTFSGTPQGGIISPLLANIYLHELDKFVSELQRKYSKPRETHTTYEYGVKDREVKKIRKRLEDANGEEKTLLVAELKRTRQELLKIPYKSQTDKTLKYVRYADDFLIGINGNKEDCEAIKRGLSEFISGTLKMELSDEKTLITHSNTPARFLGYDVRVRRSNKVKPTSAGHTQRTLSNTAELTIPLDDKIKKFVLQKGVVRQMQDGQLMPICRDIMVTQTDLEIVMSYNAELRGICNFYSLASNFNRLNYFAYLMEYSCIKTLAGKHRSSIAKVKSKFKDGKGDWCIPYETKCGIKQMYLADYRECKSVKYANDIIPNTWVIMQNNRTTFDSRLKAKKCELCGTENADSYEIHHINKVKNLKGKSDWEKYMIAKNRKTIVVCYDCHRNIHAQSYSN
jgi:group II intron reverse transcriptase/maturase